MVGFTVPQWAALVCAGLATWGLFVFINYKVRKEAIQIENVIYPKGREETGEERRRSEGRSREQGAGEGTINRGDSEKRNDTDSTELGKDIPSTSEYPRKVKLVVRKDRDSKLK